MTLEGLIPYAIGFALYYFAGRLGIKLPNPQPELPSLPTPSPKPVVDKEALDFLNWLLAVKAGKVKLDELDLEAIKSIKSALDDMK